MSAFTIRQTHNMLQDMEYNRKHWGFDPDGHYKGFTFDMRTEPVSGIAAPPSLQMIYDSFTAPNVGVPGELVTFIDPRVVTQLLAPLAAEKMGPIRKTGSWADEVYKWGSEEIFGSSEGYTDQNHEPNVNVTYNWIVRQGYRLTVTLSWGDLEQAKMAKSKVDFASRNRLAAVKIIAISRNNIYFYGISGTQTYGILTDPNLNPPLTTTTPWSNSLTSVNDVINDISSMVKELIANSQGVIDLNTPLTLSVAPTAEADLIRIVNPTFGWSANNWLQTQFGRPIEMIAVPEFEDFNGGGRIAQLMAKTLDGIAPLELGTGDILKSHGVVRHASNFTEKLSSNLFGALYNRPVGVSRLIGY